MIWYTFTSSLHINIVHPEIKYIKKILHNVYGFLNILEEGAKSLSIFMKYVLFKFPKLGADF